jgi:hypothetical protein
MNADYRRIRGFLARLAMYDWCARVSAALLRAAVIVAAVLSMDVLFVEGIPALPWAGFAAALAGTAAFWAGLAAVAATAARPLSKEAAGRRVEAAERDFRNDVVSSLALAARLESPREEGLSKPLLRQLIARTADCLGGLRPGRFVSWRPAGLWALRLGIVLLPLAFIVSSGPGLSPAALRALADPSVYWPPGKVSFQVTPGAATVARGGDLEVTAKVEGPAPGTVTLVRESDAEPQVRYFMAGGEDGLFRLRIEGVEKAFRYRLSSAAASSPWFEVEVVEPPTAGSFEARYSFPSYTGLPSRKETVNGNLEALKGTGVILEFSASKELGEAKVHLGESEYQASRTGEGRYEVSFYLNGEKSYRLDLVDSRGFVNTDRLVYSIRYLPDAPPGIEILSPLGEIDPGPFPQVPVRFRASDDFGVSGIALVSRDASGRELREQVLRGDRRGVLEGEHLWDAGAVDAPPGTLVPVYLEASDNDSISGPKTSVSNSFFIRVPDPVEEHRKTGESLEELIDRLVDLLADELDLQGRYEEQTDLAEKDWEAFPWKDVARSEDLRREVFDAAGQAGSSMRSLREQMSVDPFSRQEAFFQLDMMERRFDEMMKFSLAPMGDVARSVEPGNARREEILQKSFFLEKYADEAVVATEDMILMAEEMRHERNMADLVTAGAEMMDLQEDFLRGLEELEAGDREEMEKLLEELARMEEMLMEMLEELSSQQPDLPEDFLNSDALQQLPLSEVMEGMQKVREKLRQGDLEGAREAARELLKSLGDLMNRLRQGNEDFRREEEAAANRLKNSTLPSLDRMIRKQEELVKESARLDSEMSREAAPDAEQRSQRLAAEEGELEREATHMALEAEALKAALPFLDPGMKGDLEGASGDMKSAKESLAGKSPGGAMPSEQAALSKLKSAREKARKSLQSMQQMQALRKGRGTAFMPDWMGQPSGQSRPTRGERRNGRMGSDVRSFRIPGKEDYRAPTLFRQEILDSMREGYPAQYESDIRDYFQRITE